MPAKIADNLLSEAVEYCLIIFVAVVNTIGVVSGLIVYVSLSLALAWSLMFSLISFGTLLVLCVSAAKRTVEILRPKTRLATYRAMLPSSRGLAPAPGEASKCRWAASGWLHHARTGVSRSSPVTRPAKIAVITLRLQRLFPAHGAGLPFSNPTKTKTTNTAFGTGTPGMSRALTTRPLTI